MEKRRNSRGNEELRVLVMGARGVWRRQWREEGKRHVEQAVA